ncbi:DUF397 domain-containing protein [Streptomyces acidicola]|uniref:DUF397 domain-containing protein n=1 Tax=Streptomyces acidicola TaxID=2596892 RepID=A0A5N8WTZ4_9ACTN|nr:DUF397 domain-containing protein [Streptomyces acidicola]MPY50572.1 DUF397 domain-containing protein [Streptomyces acidicola]
MHELAWQKSTYSAEAANCLYVAAAPTGAVHLRESDEPDTILTTTPAPLHSLIRTLKTLPPERA